MFVMGMDDLDIYCMISCTGSKVPVKAVSYIFLCFCPSYLYFVYLFFMIPRDLYIMA
jgi:hypothetical protein